MIRYPGEEMMALCPLLRQWNRVASFRPLEAVPKAVLAMQQPDSMPAVIDRGSARPICCRRANTKRRIDMKRVIALLLGAGLGLTVLVQGQTVSPFKLGNFQIQNRTFVGIDLRDSEVVDYATACSAIERSFKYLLLITFHQYIA